MQKFTEPQRKPAFVRYETEADRKREAQAAHKFAAHFSVVPMKLHPDDDCDFMFLTVDGEVWAYGEVKTRTACYDPYWISEEKKWKPLERLSLIAKRPSFIVVQFPEWLGYVKVLPSSRLPGTIRAGRTDRGNPKDIEELVQIPIARFVRIE